VKRNISFVTAMVIIFLIFMLSNMIARGALGRWRFDFTDEKVYSLSEGTKNILKDIKGKITLKFYYSKKEAVGIPFLKNYSDRVSDLLNECKLAGGGQIIVESYDPRPDTEEQEWAEKFGLQGYPIQGGTPIYFGLAGLNELGDEDVISFFDPNREEFLEYDITRLIYDLGNPEKKVIGLITSLPVLGSGGNPMDPTGAMGGSEPWLFTTELEQGYTLRDLGTSPEKIDNDVDLLLIVHPKKLPDTALFAIDQFVLKGGRALIFVDPFCEADKPEADPQNPYAQMTAKRDSNMEKLFKNWGVELVQGKVAADRNRATQVNAGNNQILPFIVWLSLTDKDIDKNDVVTGKLENILMAFPGYLKTLEKEGITHTRLIETTKEASTVDAMTLGFQNPQSLLQKYIPGTEKMALALRVSGKLKTAFPDGKPKKEDKDNGEKKQSEESDSNKDEFLKESKEDTNILIVSDVDMLTDRFSVEVMNFLGQKLARPLNDNYNFIYNALENLSGSNDLISIRSRGKFSRPFTKVQEIERAAEEKWKDEEEALKSKVDEINKRLAEIQKPGEETSQQMLSKAIQDEINKYKSEKINTQEKLREVRRKLRQDKEALGNWLFVINTFLMPLLIACFGIALFIFKKKK
jgi:ABC-type uncharacterized transport system involved in gliding motility auxiliary subunit